MTYETMYVKKPNGGHAVSDLSKLSLAELKDLRAQVVALLGLKHDQALAKARMEIEEILTRAGFTIEDIRSSKQKKAKAVMYQNPNNQFETWGGRGRQPGWVKQWIESGKTLDALTVKKGEAT